MAYFTRKAVERMEAAGIVVDEARTAKLLAERGYKVLSIGRAARWESSPSYKVVALNETERDGRPGRWVATILTLPKGNHGAYSLHLVKGSRTLKRSEGKFATTVAAAHAVADLIEGGAKLG